MEPKTNPEDAWTRFAMSIFKINGILVEAGEGITRPIGQSSARWQVLGRASQPQTVAAMARDIGHARQSVQRIADVLASEGLVVFRDNLADGRARLLELTPEGASVLQAIYQRQVEWSLHIMGSLHPAQLVEIADALDDIASVLQEGLGGGRESG